MTIRSGWSNTADWKRENARQFNELARRGELHKSVGAIGEGAEAFSAVAAVTQAMMVPSGSYRLDANVPLAGDLSWWQQPGVEYDGAGEIETADHLGYYYSARLKDIRIAEMRGTPASPDSTTHPLMFLSRNTDSTATDTSNATMVLQNNKWATAADTRAQALFAEVIARAGGSSSFIEAIRTQATIPAGLTTKAYGLISVAQNDGDGINTVGVEAEVLRIGGADNLDPYAWTNGQLFDVAMLGTVRVGHKPSALFAVNPYNEVSSRAGFLVGNSFAAQGVSKSIVEYAFATYEDNVTAGLMVRGSNIYASIMVPNTTPIIRALNGAASANHNILHYSSDNLVHVGAESVGVKLYGGIYAGVLANFASDAAAAAGGVGVGQFYRNGSAVQQRVV